MSLKRHACGEVVAITEIFVALSGETDDDVGRDSNTGDGIPDQVQRPCEPIGVVPPAHRPQNRVAAALERDVEVGAEPRVRHKSKSSG